MDYAALKALAKKTAARLGAPELSGDCIGALYELMVRGIVLDINNPVLLRELAKLLGLGVRFKERNEADILGSDEEEEYRFFDHQTDGSTPETEIDRLMELECREERIERGLSRLYEGEFYMSGNQEIVLDLVYRLGYTSAEAGEYMGLTRQAVETRIKTYKRRREKLILTEEEHELLQEWLR